MSERPELWHAKTVGDKPQVYECDGDIEEDEAERAAYGDTLYAVVAQARRYET